jgi:hypothetical protein
MAATANAITRLDDPIAIFRCVQPVANNGPGNPSMINIDFRVLDECIPAHLPAYSTPGFAGMDLRACNLIRLIDSDYQDPLMVSTGRWS